MPFQNASEQPYQLPNSVLERLLTPTLAVYMDQVRANLACMRRELGGDMGRWRPHLKTTKLPRVWSELIRGGVRHFKCATLREARVLLELLQQRSILDGDLLIAYPMVGPAVKAVSHLAREFPETRLSVLCESPETAQALPADLGAFLDLNPGMDRTGLSFRNRSACLAVVQTLGTRLRGLHFYEGHIHAGVGTSAALSERRAACFELYAELCELIDFLSESLAGQDSLVVGASAFGELVTSGTPAFREALAFPAFRELPFQHRVSPGTVVFHDSRSAEELSNIDLAPAAVLLTRVISHPGPGRFTCDAGSKSLAAEAGDPCAVILGAERRGLREWVADTPSEEHLPFKYSGIGRGEDMLRPIVGELLRLVPRHVCPTVNLADSVLVVEADGSVQEDLVIARGHPLWME